MSRLDAERIARLYDGFYAEHESAEALPNFVSRPPVVDGPEYVSPTRFIAGWVVVLALVGLIFWGL